MGKFVEHIRAGSEIYDAAVKSSNGDKITQYLQVLRQIGYAGYLFFDTMTVLDAMGVKKDIRAKNVQATAYRFWLTGLTASALAGVYNTYRLRERTRVVDEKDAESKVEKVKIARYVTNRKSWIVPPHRNNSTNRSPQTTTCCQHSADLRPLRPYCAKHHAGICQL